MRFSGSATRISVRAASGHLATTAASGRNNRTMNIGDSVILEWSPADAIVAAGDKTIAKELP